MKRNDIHEFDDGATVTIIGNSVCVAKNNKVIAYDELVRGNPKTKKVGEFYYKKHILGVYDDEGEFSTPNSTYFAQYSPVPEIVIRVTKRDVGFGKKSKVLIAAPSSLVQFKDTWVPRKVNILSAIQRICQNNHPKSNPI